MQHTSPGPNQPLGMARIVAYAVLIFPLVMASTPLVSFLPAFYSQTLGMPLATVGIAIIIGRIADVLSDISVGYLSDNTKSRFGRRRPWVVLGTPLFLFTMWRLYRPTPPVGPVEFIFLMVAFYWCWTVVFIPYLAQASELTTEDRSRNRINVVQGVFLASSGIAAALVAFVLVDAKTLGIRLAIARVLRGLHLGLLDPVTTFLERTGVGVSPYGPVLAITAIMVIAAMLIGLVLYAVFVPDRPHRASGAEHVSFAAVLRNRVFHRLLLGNFLIQAGVFWYLGLLPFYVSFVLHKPDLVLLLILVPQVVAICMTPLWPRVIGRIGRAAALGTLALIPLTGTIAMFFLRPGPTWPIAAVFIYSSLAYPALIMLPYSVGADAADYAFWKTRKDSMGIHMSIVSLGVKVSLLTTGAALWLAGVCGFDPSRTDNTDSALFALRVLATLVPAAILGGGCLAMFRFPITKRRQAAIRARLTRRTRVVGVGL
jgi:Na+/melibiose symporter-like transporter